MQIFLTAIEDALADAWQRFCGDLDFVTVRQGSILEVACDAVVSPANSFGFMDGGVDSQYMEYFGADIQGRVQEMIAERHHGELLVGTADLVSTGHACIPYLIAAPTMRVPMVLAESVNAYLAARAVFLLLRNAPAFRSAVATGASVPRLLVSPPATGGLLRYGRFASSGEQICERIKSVSFPGLGTGVGQLGPNICAIQLRRAIEDVLLDHRTPPRSWAEASERHQLLFTTRPRRLQ